MSSDPEQKTVSRNPIPENRHRFLAGMLASAAGGFGLIQHLLVWSLTAGISLTSNAVAASAILVGILLSQWLRPRSRSLWVTMIGSVVLLGWLQAGLLESLLDTGLVIFGLSTSALILPALLTATLTGLLGGVVSVVVPSARAGVCGIAIAMGLMLMHSVVPFPCGRHYSSCSSLQALLSGDGIGHFHQQSSQQTCGNWGDLQSLV